MLVLDHNLTTQFLAGDADVSDLAEPKWGPIGKLVYERTYSRDIPTGEVDHEGVPVTAPERWAETVRRVVLGNLGYAPDGVDLPGEAVRLFDLIYNFKMVPAGRHLWVTGTGVHWNRNCWASDFGERPSKHFFFSGSRLFEGGGVGANYSTDRIAVTSPIVGEVIVKVLCRPDHRDIAAVTEAAGVLWQGPHSGSHRMLVADTREGWVQAWVEMIDLAGTPGTHEFLLDVSDVRPHGDLLRTFGGRASGPAPLVSSVVEIADVLNKVAVEARRMNGLEVMQVDHLIASAIVAGGARRSARMSLMHWNDPLIFDFLACKKDPSAHTTTNISVEIDDGFVSAVEAGEPHANAVLHEVAVGMALNGEPGFFNSSLHSIGEPEPVRACNPCVTGDTLIATRAGLRPVEDLEGAGQQCLVINGETWQTSDQGFFKTGTKEILELDVDGTVLRCTPDHLISTPSGWSTAGDLVPGDEVILSDSFDEPWSGPFDGVVGAKVASVWCSDGDSPSDETALAVAEGFAVSGWSERIPMPVMAQSSSFLAGFLREAFDWAARPGVNTAGAYVGFDSEVRAPLGDLRLMLGALGVFGRVVSAEDRFVLIVQGRDLSRFAKAVGSRNPVLLAVLNEAVESFGDSPGSVTVGVVVSVKDAGTADVYDCQVPGLNAFVANGVVVHNCGEASLQPWESCNLGSVNLSAFEDDDVGAIEAFELMARFLYRATLRPYPDELAAEVEARNRRIGVGFMGLQGWAAAHGVRLSDLATNEELLAGLRRFRSVVRVAADRIAEDLGTPRSVKVTALAPTGTIAQLCGTTPSLQAIHAKYFIRRVRYSDTDPAVPELLEQGYRIEDDLDAKHTKVVEFPVADAMLDRFDSSLIEQSDEMTPTQFMALVHAVQEMYCGGSDGQSISATAMIPQGLNPEGLAAVLLPWIGRLKGVTMFPNRSRPQTPIEAISNAEYEARVAELAGFVATGGDSNDGVCVGGACPVR